MPPGKTTTHPLAHAVAATLLSAGLLSHSLARAQSPDSQPIVKPEIIKSWSMPVETGKQQITVDQMTRCMATSSNVRELYESVKTRGQLIEPESVEIADSVASLQNVRAAIEAKEAELAAKRKTFDEKNAGFKRRSAEFERLRTAKLSATEAQQANAAATRFNQELAEFNRQLTLFNAALPQHLEHVAAFNVKVAESNQRAAQFNTRAVKYKADAERLSQLLAQLDDWCVGERKIVK